MKTIDMDELTKKVYNSADFTGEDKRHLQKAIYYQTPFRQYVSWTGISTLILVIIIAIIFAVGYLTRNYDVWAMEMSGKAKLAESTQSRQIAIETAKAKRESSTFEAEAEVIRAGGVAKANKIIGTSLKDNDAYLRYLWVNQLNENQQNVIYIPTEAGMPILEAGKR